MCPCIPDRIGIWKCWFLRRGENRSTLRKTSRSKGENQQQTQPTYGVDAGFEPGPHWWEVSALTTAPPLFPLLTWEPGLLIGYYSWPVFSCVCYVGHRASSSSVVIASEHLELGIFLSFLVLEFFFFQIILYRLGLIHWWMADFEQVPNTVLYDRCSYN